MILPLLLLAAQVTPVQPIVKGTALPPPGSEEAGAMAPVNALFDGLARRDGTIILAAMRPDASATVAVEKADGSRDVRRMTAAEFASHIKPGPEHFEERLTDPAVEVDGDIAMVWSPYIFLLDGKVQHCGVDHFDVVREAGHWRIANVTWSQRTTGCPAQ